LLLLLKGIFLPASSISELWCTSIGFLVVGRHINRFISKAVLLRIGWRL